MLFFVR